MSRMNLKDTFVALENDDSDLPPAEEVEVEVGEDSLEADLGDVAESATDVAQAEEQVEVMEDVAESMEAIAQFINASLEHGGMTPREAGAIQLAQNIALGRLGLEAVSIGQEDFAGASSRHSASVSMEASVKEWAIRIWEAIKRGIARMREFVKNLYVKLFDAAPKLQRRAEALVAKTKDLKEKGDATEVKLSGADASALAVGQSVPSTLPEITTLLKGVNEQVMGEFRGSAISFAESVEQAIRGVKTDGSGDMDASIKAAISKLKVPTMGRMTDASTDKRFEGRNAQKSARLPGNKALFLVGVTKGEDAGKLEKLSKIELKVDDYDAGGQKKMGEFSLKVPAPQTIAQAAKAIAVIAGEIAEYRKKFAQTDALIAKLKSAGDAFAKNLDASEKITPEDKTKGRELLNVVGSASNVVDKGVADALRYVLSTAARTLQIAERCAAVYK